MKKINLNNLPFDQQESIRSYMEITGQKKPPKLYEIDIEFNIDDYKLVPIKILLTLLKEAIEENRYEDAEDLKKIIKKRNFSITIEENKLYLKKK